MSVIGIYDSDLMEHGPTVPNLECMKLLTWHKRHKDIAVLVPKLDPVPFTHFFIRKDYNDYLYNSLYSAQNVTFGGYAFSDSYVPLDLKIENCPPDINAYKKYVSRIKASGFGEDKPVFQQKNNLSLLNAEHVRFSLDGKTVNPNWKMQLRRENNAQKLFIAHDKNLGFISGATEEMKKISKECNYLFGCKFPIYLKPNDIETLKGWNELRKSANFFELHYYGILEDDFFYHYNMNNNFIYHIDSVSENDFIQYILPKLFNQALFLRTNNKTITLKYEGPEVWEKFIELIEVYINTRKKQYTLYELIKSIVSLSFYRKKSALTYLIPNIPFYKEAFAKIRQENYEVFKKFYKSYQIEEGEFYGNKET